MDININSNTTLGERIKEHRNRLGFSQEKLAELIGISRQAVTKWEADLSIPCMENLMTLADIFGISLNELSGKINKEPLNLRKVKSSFRTYGRITLILSAGLLTATTILLIIQFFNKEIDFNVLPIVLGANGSVWLILGLIFFMTTNLENEKLKRIKKDGLRYDAKVERIIRNHYWIRIGSMLSGYAECIYQNQDGKKCLVKSSSFILEEQPVNYIVSVYVNRINPKDYAVELNLFGEKSSQVEYDYITKNNIFTFWR